MNPDQHNTLAELILVLAEVRRVARQLEADQKVTMSRSPRLLRELLETLQVMAGERTVQSASFYSCHSSENTPDNDSEDDLPKTFRDVLSLAEHCAERDEARKMY